LGSDAHLKHTTVDENRTEVCQLTTADRTLDHPQEAWVSAAVQPQAGGRVKLCARSDDVSPLDARDIKPRNFGDLWQQRQDILIRLDPLCLRRVHSRGAAVRKPYPGEPARLAEHVGRQLGQLRPDLADSLPNAECGSGSLFALEVQHSGLVDPIGEV